MKKSRRDFVVALTIMLAAVAAPVFAAEPMTISGVRETTDKEGTKIYYYFSPGGASDTAVGVISGTNAAGAQIFPV